MTLIICVTKRKFVYLMHGESKQYRNVGVQSRKRFSAGPGKENGGSCPKPRTPRRLQQSVSKGQVRESPGRSDHSVPVNLQQDHCYSLSHNFLLCKWKSVILLKVRALRLGSPVYFRLQATSSCVCMCLCGKGKYCVYCSYKTKKTGSWHSKDQNSSEPKIILFQKIILLIFNF